MEKNLSKGTKKAFAKLNLNRMRKKCGKNSARQFADDDSKRDEITILRLVTRCVLAENRVQSVIIKCLQM